MPRRRHTRRALTPVLAGAALFVSCYLAYTAVHFYIQSLIDSRAEEGWYEEVTPVPQTTATPTSVSTPTPTSKPTSTGTLPAQVLLEVPFIVQAPFANWDALHKEACEEASLLMVKHFLNKTSPSSLEAADQEIKDLVAYQEVNGYAVDITVRQLATIASDLFKLTTARIENTVTTENVQAELAAGRPVILPAAGQQLPNPYFTPPGPPYHMLVVIGYENGEFITNDPGTRNGSAFRYKYNDLIGAVRDWNSGNDILQGTPRYLVFD